MDNTSNLKNIPIFKETNELNIEYDENVNINCTN